jgi:malate dehydrogenase
VGSNTFRASIISFTNSRHQSTSAFNVAVVGAAGGIGQPLALLLKLNPLVGDLRVFDVANTKVHAADGKPETIVATVLGTAADLSHIDSNAKVTGFGGDSMGAALKDCHLVIVPAGVPRKPGMTRDDLFNVNASIVANIARTVASACPKAMLCIISNPVNSTVPIAAEVLKKAGVYDPKRLFGVTTLDVCRANTFVARNQNINPAKVKVPVVGGHAGTTIVPLLSRAEAEGHEIKLSAEDVAKLTQRIMFGGDEVVAAKAGAGSATLSMAVAGANFAGRLLRAMAGEKDIVECTFVESTVTKARFFASPVRLGKNGVEEILPLGTLNAAEQKYVDDMLKDLTAQIGKGEQYVANLK